MHSALFVVSLLAAVLNIIFMPLSESVARLFGYTELVAFILSALFCVLRTKNGRLYFKFPNTVLPLVITSSIAFVISIVLFGCDDIFSAALSLTEFIAFYFILSFGKCDKIRIDFNIISSINYLLTAVFIAYTFLNVDFKYTVANDYGYEIFTMGIGNPNSASLYVFVSICIHILDIIAAEKPMKKALSFIAVGILAYILILLSSRTIILCLIILLLAVIFKLYRRLTFTAGLFILFLPVEALLLQLVFRDYLADIMLFGETINTGRTEIFSTVIKDLLDNPIRILTGNLSEYCFCNFHNGPLAVIANIGIIGSFSFYFLWWKKLKFLFDNVENDFRKIALLCVLIFLLISSSEVMTVTGAVPYGIFLLAFVKISQGEICLREDIK